jgi:hypothetical protein
MGRRALPQSARRRSASKAECDRLHTAAQEYKNSWNGSKFTLSYRDVAVKHNVNFQAVRRVVQGGLTKYESAQQRCRLTPAEQAALCEEIEQAAARRVPLNHTKIRLRVNTLLAFKYGPSYVAVGIGYVNGFLDMNRDRLATYWSRSVDTVRVNGLNKAAVDHWFQEILHPELVLKGAKPHQIFGMDETGTPAEDQGTEKVVGGKGLGRATKKRVANRQNITAFVAICAAGYACRPHIIFKAKHCAAHWIRNNVAKAS